MSPPARPPPARSSVAARCGRRPSLRLAAVGCPCPPVSAADALLLQNGTKFPARLAAECPCGLLSAYLVRLHAFVGRDRDKWTQTLVGAASFLTNLVLEHGQLWASPWPVPAGRRLCAQPVAAATGCGGAGPARCGTCGHGWAPTRSRCGLLSAYRLIAKKRGRTRPRRYVGVAKVYSIGDLWGLALHTKVLERRARVHVTGKDGKGASAGAPAEEGMRSLPRPACLDHLPFAHCHCQILRLPLPLPLRKQAPPRRLKTYPLRYRDQILSAP